MVGYNGEWLILWCQLMVIGFRSSALLVHFKFLFDLPIDRTYTFLTYDIGVPFLAR